MHQSQKTTNKRRNQIIIIYYLNKHLIHTVLHIKAHSLLRNIENEQ